MEWHKSFSQKMAEKYHARNSKFKSANIKKKIVFHPTTAQINMPEVIKNEPCLKNVVESMTTISAVENDYIRLLAQIAIIKSEYEEKHKKESERLAEEEEQTKKLLKSCILEQLKLRKEHIDFEELVISDIYKRQRCKNALHYLIPEIEEKTCDRRFTLRKITFHELCYKSLKQSVAKLQMFEDCLQKFLEMQPDFKSLDAIVKRYDELSEMRYTIVKEQLDAIILTENLRFEKVQYIEDQSTRLLGYENKVIELKQKYKSCKRISESWQRLIINAQASYLHKVHNIITTIQTGYSLYREMSVLLKKPITYSKYQPLKWMKELKKYLNQLQSLVEMANLMEIGEVTVG